MKDDERIIEAARARMSEAIEADRDNREEALNDLENLAGRQWEKSIKDARESDGRPCLTINRLPQFSRQVTGDIRRMNPSINIMPGDDEAQEDVAEVLEGLVRQIQYKCDASSVYEGAAESAANCGMGYFRIRSDYVDDTSFDQEILIERIHNPFSVYFDPKARESTREDGRFCFVTEAMRRDEFEEQFPDAAMVGVDADDQTDGMEHWHDKGSVVVAEYFWKEPVKRTLGLLRDGTVVEDPVAPMDVVRKREVTGHKVMWTKVSGKEVLEGPVEIPCSYIPVIGVMGEELHVGDEVVRSSVIRYAKDPQRLYNYWRSAQTEMVALQPKAPFIVTAEQVSGYEGFWNEANNSNRPYLPYKADPKAPPPQRATPPVPSSGMMQEVMTAAEDMKATTGIYDASLGGMSNETSGVAIRQRQMESDVSTSIYSDNLAKAITLCGKILVEMIPKIYDTKRMVIILGKDDAQKVVEVNAIRVSMDGVQWVNRLDVGRYTVRVNVGPNYATMRQETSERMIEFVKAFPPAATVVGDLVAKNMDWPGADQFAERLRKILPPGMISPEDMSDEERQAMEQGQQMQAMQMQSEMAGKQVELQKSAAEAQEAEFDARKAGLEVSEKQLELAIASGQLNAVIQEAVARALQSAMMAPAGVAVPQRTF